MGLVYTTGTISINDWNTKVVWQKKNKNKMLLWFKEYKYVLDFCTVLFYKYRRL